MARSSLLRSYVNLAEPDFRLMIGWLTAALRPVGPYPVLVLNGEQASGKSTLARILAHPDRPADVSCHWRFPAARTT